jgi:hypothetical protein
LDQATARVIATTTSQFLRDEEVNILRNRRLTALIQARGRIKYNQSGKDLEWRVRYKRVPIQGYADADTLAFPRRDRWKVARLPWRGYAITDSASKMETLMNRGTEAIIKIYSQIAESLKDDMELGTYGGAWSGTWPDGRGDSHYDFWSPIIVQYLQNAFGVTDGNTWAENCLRAIRFGLRSAGRNKGRRGMVDLVLLSGSMYEDVMNALDDKQRIIVNRGRKGGLVDMGFSDVITIDGAELTWEYGIPDGVGYGLNVDDIELLSMQGQLFVPDGPDWDISSRSWRFAVDFLGNMKTNPRSHFKLVAL